MAGHAPCSLLLDNQRNRTLLPFRVKILLTLIVVAPFAFFLPLACHHPTTAADEILNTHNVAKQTFRVLYSNDTLNMATNISPFRKRGESFDDGIIRASVDETAGLVENTGKVDVHILQPGFCWVPWWQSKIYPPDEHYKWFKEKTGLPIDPISQYVLDGGDAIRVFVDQCRKREISPFVSFRLNDCHGNEYHDILTQLAQRRKTIKDIKERDKINAFFTCN